MKIYTNICKISIHQKIYFPFYLSTIFNNENCILVRKIFQPNAEIGDFFRNLSTIYEAKRRQIALLFLHILYVLKLVLGCLKNFALKFGRVVFQVLSSRLPNLKPTMINNVIEKNENLYKHM